MSEPSMLLATPSIHVCIPKQKVCLLQLLRQLRVLIVNHLSAMMFAQKKQHFISIFIVKLIGDTRAGSNFSESARESESHLIHTSIVISITKLLYGEVVM